jgi:hypothetical protein
LIALKAFFEMVGAVPISKEPALNADCQSDGTLRVFAVRRDQVCALGVEIYRAVPNEV